MRSSASTAPADLPEDQAELLAGTPYRALRLLGRGGMGEVFDAEHRALNKRVVVKLLHAQLAADPRFADRLRVEAQALAAVSSPHVVSVSDLGQTPAGRPYLVMERLEGHTLREELQSRGVIPVAEALDIVRQVLAALAAVHRLGIVHRDVKADNVFLCGPTNGGTRIVKVLDFGIAKLVPSDASPSPVPAAQYATEEGVLVGSPRTVSPEQARFQPVDARTDVYATGLLLCTLVAGRGPFDHARDMLELLNAHVREVPAPPSRLAEQFVPPDVDRAVLKALAKRPEHRFHSAESFAEELARIASRLGDSTALLVPAPPSARAPRSDDGAAVGTPGRPMEATDHGTLVIRPDGCDPAPGPHAEGWLTSPPQAPRVLEAQANLALDHAPSSHMRAFVLLTFASTIIFSLIAGLVFHYWAGR
jgi:serine/threonine-protein kinase